MLRLRLLVLFVLLLVLPLQGVAAGLSSLLCAASAEHGKEHAVHMHHHGVVDHAHPASPDQHSSDDSGTSTADWTGHLCCHASVPGAPVSAKTAAQPALPAYQPVITRLATLHVPERPQRPPRA
jgi:hypothetical protein